MRLARAAVGTFQPTLTPDELAVTGVVVPRPWAVGETLERVLQVDLEVVGGYVIEATEEGLEQDGDGRMLMAPPSGALAIGRDSVRQDVGRRFIRATPPAKN